MADLVQFAKYAINLFEKDIKELDEIMLGDSTYPSGQEKRRERRKINKKNKSINIRNNGQR